MIWGALAAAVAAAIVGWTMKRPTGALCLGFVVGWLVAFGFGLFHGLGFAGALAELGVPEHEVPLALLSFNLGVEAGQIVFILAVLCVLGLARGLRLPLPAWGWHVTSYAIGGGAAFWTIERVAGSLGITV